MTFFGTALLCTVLLVFQLARPETGALVMTGALLYLIGSIGVTMVFNVPLNNRLAAVSPSAPDLESEWPAYRVPWTRWNHVRTVACLLAAALFAYAIAE